jgi:phage-related protein
MMKVQSRLENKPLRHSNRRHGEHHGQVLAQTGQCPPSAKPLKGLGGGAVELVDDFDGDTYRTAYTARFNSAVYVLHSFKKKPKQGIKTP